MTDQMHWTLADNQIELQKAYRDMDRMIAATIKGWKNLSYKDLKAARVPLPPAWGSVNERIFIEVPSLCDSGVLLRLYREEDLPAFSQDHSEVLNTIFAMAREGVDVTFSYRPDVYDGVEEQTTGCYYCNIISNVYGDICRKNDKAANLAFWEAAVEFYAKLNRGSS